MKCANTQNSEKIRFIASRLRTVTRPHTNQNTHRHTHARSHTDPNLWPDNDEYEHSIKMLWQCFYMYNSHIEATTATHLLPSFLFFFSFSAQWFELLLNITAFAMINTFMHCHYWHLLYLFSRKSFLLPSWNLPLFFLSSQTVWSV